MRQLQTINPGMFQLGDDTPTTDMNTNALLNSASPNAIFSTPSSDSNETFNANPAWTNGGAHNPSWPMDFNNQFNSPGALAFTPSPKANGATPAVSSKSSVGPIGRSPLHIAPISTKSRVETQINVVMTLEQPPPGIEFLHLPLHTIAKSKLLSKEDYDMNKALELHTMLVCTSAMHNPAHKEKALRQAAAQNNAEIQDRAQRLRRVADDDRNNMANVDDADKPSNGGEVRICNNCIQRERKRAGRKKLKKEEEQQHWERFETERVVVFNSNEFLPFKTIDSAQRESVADDASYVAPEGALQVSAAMRIACYCRHQQEKEGFRVIFTLKDQQGNVIAQQMSDSILITDDHKTHPPSFSTTMPSEMLYGAAFAPQHGLSTSHSMINLYEQGAQPFTSSRSTGNLAALGYGQQYNSHSHVHQMPHSGYTSQATSATMTPNSLSRPGSPTGHSGPNKKRKASGSHKRMMSGLMMTPRVDTSQPPSSAMPSALSVASPFSPTNDGFGQQSYMAMPQHNGHAPYQFSSGPPTPNENPSGMFTQTHIDQAMSRVSTNSAQAYFSHPSSAVPSRSNSPIMQQSRPNMAAYARTPIQTPTNSMQAARQQVYQQPSHLPIQQQHSNSSQEALEPPMPTITKILPTGGPVTGGTEVALYGYNFTNGMNCFFGDQQATATYYGPQSVLATSPPSRPGGVNVTLVPANVQQNPRYTPGVAAGPVFTYADKNPLMAPVGGQQAVNPQVMEMFLRSMAQSGQYDAGQLTPGALQEMAKNLADQFGSHQQQHGGGMNAGMAQQPQQGMNGMGGMGGMVQPQQQQPQQPQQGSNGMMQHQGNGMVQHPQQGMGQQPPGGYGQSGQF